MTRSVGFGHPAIRAITPIFLLTIALFTVFIKPTNAQPPLHVSAANTSASPPIVTSSNQERQLSLERDRLAFEERKFEAEAKRENEKLETEKSKVVWSAVSSIVPIVAALTTLVYGIWSFRKQSIATAQIQNEGAKLQFEIKAAEIAFAGRTPKAVENRGRVLKKMFGDRLPENFPAPFEPVEHGGGKEAPAEKITFLELLLKYPDKEQHIFNLWTELFGDSWLERVKAILLDELAKDHKERSLKVEGSQPYSAEETPAETNSDALLIPPVSASDAPSESKQATPEPRHSACVVHVLSERNSLPNQPTDADPLFSNARRSTLAE